MVSLDIEFPDRSVHKMVPHGSSWYRTDVKVIVISINRPHGSSWYRTDIKGIINRSVYKNITNSLATILMISHVLL